MALLSEAQVQQLTVVFKDMKDPVTLVFFTQEFECQYCKETRNILDEVKGLSDKISLEVYDFQKDPAAVQQYAIRQIPAIAVVGQKDYGVRYYGVPSGYEFTTLLDAVMMISKGDSGLTEKSKAAVKALAKDIHLQVFVTPMCPYCPMGASMANRFAVESDRITADTIEAAEFPHLARKYDVRGVPRTLINETIAVEGAVPEHVLLGKILEA